MHLLLIFLHSQLFRCAKWKMAKQHLESFNQLKCDCFRYNYMVSTINQAHKQFEMDNNDWKTTRLDAVNYLIKDYRLIIKMISAHVTQHLQLLQSSPGSSSKDNIRQDWFEPKNWLIALPASATFPGRASSQRTHQDQDRPHHRPTLPCMTLPQYIKNFIGRKLSWQNNKLYSLWHNIGITRLTRAE